MSQNVEHTQQNTHIWSKLQQRSFLIEGNGEIPKGEQILWMAWEEGGAVSEGVKDFLQSSYSVWILEEEEEVFFAICIRFWFWKHVVKTGVLFCKNILALSDAFWNFENILVLTPIRQI